MTIGLAASLAGLPAQADATESADQRKAKIASKIRNADYWQTCQRIGPAARAQSTSKISEERQILLRISSEPPFSVRQADLAAIRNREPRLGMNMCSLIASLGLPVRNNRSVSRHGERFQFVYERPRRYVYLQGTHAGDALVTSWQD